MLAILMQTCYIFYQNSALRLRITVRDQPLIAEMHQTKANSFP